MDIDYLIDRLEAILTSGKRVPLSNKVMVDEQECLDLIDQMRAVVPEEVKAAKRTLLDRERILSDAEEDSRQILEHAEQEREIMLSREGLLAEAERRRDEIISEANQEAFDLRTQAQNLYDDAVGQTQEMREGANNYTVQVLQELETLLGKHLGMVRNGLQSFQQQAQQYQEQLEGYQRQNRPNYAAPTPPADTRLASTRTRATRSNGETPAASNPPTPERRSAVTNPAPAVPERKSPTPISAGSGNTQATRRPAVSNQPQQPERRVTPPSATAFGGRSLNPVPKPNRPGEGDEGSDLDDDEFLNPDNSNNSATRRPGLPGSGSARPSNRNDY